MGEKQKVKRKATKTVVRRTKPKTIDSSEITDLVYLRKGKGLRVCMDCGYVEGYTKEKQVGVGTKEIVTQEEQEEHKSIHIAFDKLYKDAVKESKKKGTARTVLTYAEIMDLEEELQAQEREIKRQSKKKQKAFMRNKAMVMFNRSVRFWEYRVEGESSGPKRHMVRRHPVFEEYEILLWNTPIHIVEMAKLVGTDIVREEVEEKQANRRIQLWGVCDQEGLRRDYGLYKSVETTGKKGECIIQLDHLDTCRASGKKGTITSGDITCVDSLDTNFVMLLENFVTEIAPAI